MLALNAAYDLCLRLRSGDSAEQAMAIAPGGRRRSRLAVCRDAAEIYHLARAEAEAIIDRQLSIISEQWDAAQTHRGATGAVVATAIPEPSHPLRRLASPPASSRRPAGVYPGAAAG
jgi:hypothetical protein